MPKKAPPVFLDYDQAALDAAYDQAAYAPNREQLIKRRIRDSERARQRSATPNARPTGQPRSSSSTSIVPDAPRLPSSSSFMAGPGAAAGREIS